MTVPNPNLWWPNGLGDPYLYEMKIKLMKDGYIVDIVDKKIGLRTLTMTREADANGESFDITINGHRIFAMGADYIPEDTFIARPTYEVTKRLIKDCVRANYNCLRVWGGGVYPNDSFFELCDEYGLVVWEDFMFACGVYRLTEEFKHNITEEFVDNIRRIRHHACLGLWCGNNEMEWAFVEWNLPKDERLRLDYLLMYEKLIPDVLSVYDPDTFYWSASPSSGGGFETPNEDSKGDVHYWKVFHENEHYKKFREHYFRFASEYGMQSFPDMKTIRSFAEVKDMNAFSPVMENHNKCVDPINGNIKILMNMAGEFQLPASFEGQVYISQLFQAETIKCAVEHFRRNRGRCMGSTYWQVNDNYPVASWSSIDVYGRWKGMHYLAKRFYRPLLLSAYEDGLLGHIHMNNDTLQAFEGVCRWQLRHIDDGILSEGEVEIKIQQLSTIHVTDVEVMMDEQFVIKVTANNYAKSVAIELAEADGGLSDNYFDILPGETVEITIVEWYAKIPEDRQSLLDQIQLSTVGNIKFHTFTKDS